MTTVAYRDGVMASDSQYTGAYKTKGKKVFKVNGALIGIAGNVTQCLAFVDWYKNPDAPSPKIKENDDFEALVVKEDGIEYWDYHLRPIPIGEEFAAIGSGSGFALGAMAMGADAKKAVRVAERFDHYTGGAVRAASLK